MGQMGENLPPKGRGCLWMISLFMVPILMHVLIGTLEFLTDALRLTLFLTLRNAILWYMRV